MELVVHGIEIGGVLILEVAWLVACVKAPAITGASGAWQSRLQPQRLLSMAALTTG